MTNILEDTSYSCEIVVSDVEDDDFEINVITDDDLGLGIVSEEGLQCTVSAGDLLYQGDVDYFGAASCVIRVSDAYGYSDYSLEVDIQNVNDAPVIHVIEPESSVKILVGGVGQEFSIFVEDIDGDITETAWFVEQGVQIENVGSGNTFTFGEPYTANEGTYIVKAIVTDYL